MSVPKPTEQSIVNACLQLLAARGVFAWRVNQGAVKTDGRFIRFSSAVGISDIVGVMPTIVTREFVKADTDIDGDARRIPSGRMVCVEVKRPGLGKRSRPEPHQQAFLDAVAKCGGLALCVTDVLQLDAALTAEGL